MTRPFFIVDVFAERPYAGNQLAVVLDAEGLSDGTMQSVAAEANYSETAFVSSAPERDGAFRLRNAPLQPGRSHSRGIRCWVAAGSSAITFGPADPEK